MKFIDLDKSRILADSIITSDGFYEYTLGSPLEITTIRCNHVNQVMSKSLSSDVKDDKLMVKYKPTNKIYFSKAFMNSDSDENYASCYINQKTGSLYVGALKEFGDDSGVLVLSGYLSINNLVEEDRPVLCNKKLFNTVKNRIRVLSVGVRGGKLYGLFYIPGVKGLSISVRDRKDMGYSPITYKLGKRDNYEAFTIKDWFDNTKVKEV